MSDIYFASVTIHVLAALFWLGGMFFLAVVGAPVLRGVDPALRVTLFQKLGERFRTSGWVAIGTLIVTGIITLYYRGLLTMELWDDPGFWSSALGRALAWKLIAVLAMLIVSAIHDFALGPAAARLRPGSPEAARARRSASRLARVNAILGIIVVTAAVRLARGG